MAKNKKEHNIAYQLLDFNLESQKPLSIKKEPEEYGYSVEIGRSVDLEEDLFFISTIVDSKSGPDNEPFFQATTVSTYAVKDLSDIYDEMPRDFIANLMAISYSTTRGYLMALNQGNFLEHSPLPLLTIQQIAKQISEEESQKEKADK
ncbi:MAG: hypothetical protein U5K69_01030 [Balneolaceae bacterium]|nr:hypothetical protein [Balneolaceae bacterium]